MLCYASMLNFWKGFKLIRHENNNFSLEEPLFYNSLLGDNICTNCNTIVKTFMEKRLTKVSDLVNTSSKTGVLKLNIQRSESELSSKSKGQK